MPTFRALLLAFPLVACVTITSAAEDPPVEWPTSQEIWDQGKHNAFTDLVRWHDRFYCVFRESAAHVPRNPAEDGKIRLIASDDTETWESVALIAQEGVDLRDPKLSITPDDRLMIVMGGSHYDHGRLLRRRPLAAFLQRDGTTSNPIPLVIDPRIAGDTDWLWRVTWHEGIGYGVVYQPGENTWGLHLLKTNDGIHYDQITELDLPGRPNESTIRFATDGRMLIVVRNEDGQGRGHFGTSESPYTEWTWHDIDARLGGPDLLPLADGTLLLSTRHYGNPTRTVVGLLSENGHFTPRILLPSAGDTSYPRLLIQDTHLLVAYYSSHEGHASIYLARIPLDELP